ncbi:MAG: TrmB family transcriptional regulator [Candidatus Saccharimonadales bacterium]
MDTVLLSLFEHTKLNDNQRRVYLALLQSGNATVAQIADVAQIKRSNVYNLVTELESIGYIHQVINSKKKTYAAADPNKIVSELKQGVKSFEEMLPYLHAIQRRNGKLYVQYYSGLEGVKQAFSQIHKPKEARYVTSIERASETIPEEVERWKKLYKTGKAATDSRHILTDTEIDQNFALVLTNREQLVRYLSPEMSLNVDIALVDDRVFLTSFEDGIHVTVIRSQATYNALCTLYDLAWSNLSK